MNVMLHLLEKQLSEEEKKDFDELCSYKYNLLQHMQRLRACAKHDLTAMTNKKYEEGRLR